MHIPAATCGAHTKLFAISRKMELILDLAIKAPAHVEICFAHIRRKPQQPSLVLGKSGPGSERLTYPLMRNDALRQFFGLLL
ncbi:hypothetical protein D9M72_349850 [compost metagenome]